MASNLRVDTILPSTGTSLGIGTASGTTTVTNNLSVTNNLTATGSVNAASASITGNLGVGGVLTYEDVTNIDSVGIITARSGIKIGPSAGVAGTFFADGSYVTAGIITAGSYRGDGSQLTGISVGIATEAVTPSGITTHLLLSSADDHKVLATGNVTIDVTGGTEADSHTVRIENVGVATVGFSTAFKFPSGGTPNLPTASGSISLISFSVHKTGAAGTTLLAGASVNFS